MAILMEMWHIATMMESRDMVILRDSGVMAILMEMCDMSILREGGTWFYRLKYRAWLYLGKEWTSLS